VEQACGARGGLLGQGGGLDDMPVLFVDHSLFIIVWICNCFRLFTSFVRPLFFTRRAMTCECATGSGTSLNTMNRLNRGVSRDGKIREVLQPALSIHSCAEYVKTTRCRLFWDWADFDSSHHQINRFRCMVWFGQINRYMAVACCWCLISFASMEHNETLHSLAVHVLRTN
jgi:hypothetical protein